MPKEYNLKVSPFNKNRIMKMGKEILSHSQEDRDLALEAHRFFRELLDENPQDATAKNLMVETLKVAQASKNNAIKIIGLMIKLEETGKDNKTKATGGSANSLFNQLDGLNE